MTKTENWGYEHPDVVGANALMFFTWDLSKTIELVFKDSNEENIESYLPKAQSLVDALLQKYIDLKANPEAFEGQSITLSLERNEKTNTVLIALQTSKELEDRIIAMQSRTPAGHS
ncbi:hypothetical protein F9B74_01135 [Pelistega sp. NLN82]|uniref:Uncharacterized protein n=1 Tax=Pelistega ratti TaxID=2652177 RepID=A0A6L9Y550_9BURK|nr:hypothetical protein [Pelistega ratti]NEN74934.1 hypothetical protein [Pelistega ratti]